MLHKAWNSKGEMPYRFPRSSVKFQGHTVQNITDFDPNWAFPDYRPVAAFKSLRFALFKVICQISRSHGENFVYPHSAFLDCNSSLNSPMVMKWCTNLETAKKRCPIVLQGHLSNFKATQWKNPRFFFYPNWTFPDCNSSLNSLMATKWCTAWNSIEEMSYCFSWFEKGWVISFIQMQRWSIVYELSPSQCFNCVIETIWKGLQWSDDRAFYGVTVFIPISVSQIFRMSPCINQVNRRL